MVYYPLGIALKRPEHKALVQATNSRSKEAELLPTDFFVITAKRRGR